MLLSNIKRLLAILVVLLITQGIAAQTAVPVFESPSLKQYTQDDGLAQNSINDFCFDRYGYLWIGTMGGLSRFDGQHFRNIFSGNADTRTRIMRFLKGSQDTMFVISSTADIYTITGSKVTGPEPYNIRQHGILLWNLKQSVSVHGDYDLHHSSYTNYNLNWSKYFSAICGMPGNRDTLVLLNGDTSAYYAGRFMHRLRPSISIDFFGNSYPIGRYLVNFNQQYKRLDVYRADNSMFSVPLPVKDASSWNHYQGSSGETFYISADSLLYEVRAGRHGAVLEYRLMMNNFPNDIGAGNILNINDEQLVIGSRTKGLFIYSRKRTNTLVRPAVNMYDNYFYGQTLMPDGNTILTGGKALFTKDGYQGELQQYKGVVPAYARDIHTKAVLRGSSGYWYQVEDGRRFKLRYGDRYLVRSSWPGAPDEKKIKLLYGDICNYFFEDSKGNIWFYANHILYFIEKGTDRILQLTKEGINMQSVFSHVNTFCETDKGIIYMGTGKGLFFFDPNNLKAGIRECNFPKVDVRYLWFDEATGSLWIGTYGKGLSILKKNGRFISLPLDKDNNLGIVHHIVKDKYDRCWISTNNGLYVTSAKSIRAFENDSLRRPYYYRFSTADGFLSNEFNGGCQSPMILLPDGHLSVSSTNGLAFINTNDNLIRFGSNILKASVRLGEQYFGPSHGTINISPRNNEQVNIEVMAPTWGTNNNPQLEYRIIKNGQYTGQWQDVNDEHMISIPFLSHGTYEIIIRKRTGLEDDDFVYCLLRISKSPRWYQTDFMYLLSLLLIAVIAYLINLWRIRSLKRKNVKLQEKVAEATTALKDKNDVLMETVNTRDKLILLFNHDLSTPLFYINRIAQDLAQAELGGVNNSKAQMLASSTQDLEELMNEMLLWIQLQQGQRSIRLFNEELDLEEIVRKNLQLFANRINQNAITLSFVFPVAVYVFADNKILGSIIYNLVTNAIKYTSNGVIQVEGGIDDNDNGCGYLTIKSRSDTDHIATGRITDLKGSTGQTRIKKTDAEQSRQIGLQLVKSFSEMLGITVSFRYADDGVFAAEISGLKVSS